MPSPIFQFKPQKGKAFENLPAKSVEPFGSTKWLVSVKYDGFQVFIQKFGQSVRMFSSDWKEFTIPPLVPIIQQMDGDFTLVGEFLFDCGGRLGCRTKSAVLTTLRVDFAKNIRSTIDFSKVHIKVFDILHHNETLVNLPYSERLSLIELKDKSMISKIDVQEMSGDEAKVYARQLISDGFEGAMCASADEKYHIGKRVNHVVKLKGRLTADLECIDVELAEEGSQFDGLIGALVLMDSKGRTTRCGTGLTPKDRKLPREHFVGKIVEITYEQILDTYIQPAYQCVRLDKTESD